MTTMKVRIDPRDGWTFFDATSLECGFSRCPSCTKVRDISISLDHVPLGDRISPVRCWCECGAEAANPPRAMLSGAVIVQPFGREPRRFGDLFAVMSHYTQHDLVRVFDDGSDGGDATRRVHYVLCDRGMLESAFADVWAADEDEKESQP